MPVIDAYTGHMPMMKIRLKGDMQRFLTKLMKKYFLAAYCNIHWCHLVNTTEPS